MISTLKEVGRGKRGARDLSYEEALQGAELILTGKATRRRSAHFWLRGLPFANSRIGVPLFSRLQPLAAPLQ